MNDTKPWYKSKAIWASVAALVQMAAMAIGYEVDPTFKEAFASTALQVGVVIAGAVAVYGRVVATTKLIHKGEDT